MFRIKSIAKEHVALTIKVQHDFTLYSEVMLLKSNFATIIICAACEIGISVDIMWGMN